MEKIMLIILVFCGLIGLFNIISMSEKLTNISICDLDRCLPIEEFLHHKYSDMCLTSPCEIVEE